MTKEELRKIYLQKRRSLTDFVYEKLSRQVCENFFNRIDLSSIKVLHVFIPIEKNKEPNTILIIERIQSKFPHIHLVVPRVNHATEKMENFLFEGLHQLGKNKWDILEPRAGKQIESQKIDMALIPLLVFDKDGHRVGYGKGFYDKFLNECRFDCKKVGLSFYPPIEKIGDNQSHDVMLDYCISPEKLFQF